MISEWKQVATGAWSFILAVLSAVFLAAGAAWEYFTPADLGLPTWAYLAIASALSAATGGARLIRQDDLAARIAEQLRDQAGAVSKKAMVGVMAAVVAIGVPLTAKWEGRENIAYWDRFGSVWTVCYGETRDVRRGDSYSDAECIAMLEDRWVEFYGGMIACAPQMAQAPVEVQAAVTSWAYNVGTGAACRSTLARHLRAGDWRAACEQLPRWNRSGGQVVRGLINRRSDERAICLSGLD